MRRNVVVFYLVFLGSLLSCNSVDKSYSGSGISFIKLTEKKINNLILFAKVWGYLKYYQPSATFRNNWDECFFRILYKIKDIEDKKDALKILEDWIDSLPNDSSFSKLKIDSSKVKLYPDTEWIKDTLLLGKKISNHLVQVRNLVRIDFSNYVKFDSIIGHPIFTNEKTYEEIAHPDAGLRLLTLVRFWNIVEYFYPYKNLIGRDWNSILEEFIPKFIDGSTDIDYRLNILALLASINDSHAKITNEDKILASYYGKRYLPIIFDFVEDKLIIKDFSSRAIINETPLRIGDIILQIDNHDIEQLISQKEIYTSGSNRYSKMRDLASEFQRTNNEFVSISYMHNGVIANYKIRSYIPTYIPSDGHLFSDSCFSMVAPGIIRIFPKTILNEYIENTLPMLLSSKGFIIDLRCYPSDFIIYTLGKFLMPNKTAFVQYTSPIPRIPGLFMFKDTVFVGEKNPKYYKGKIVIIVNEQTQSNAEYTAMSFRVAPKAIVIGSNTAGADGNVSEIPLPCGVTTTITGLGIYYLDGSDTQRKGIKIDVEIKPTIKGIASGKDELLDKAINIINDLK